MRKVTELPVADDEVCVSCYDPVVVTCNNQYFPGVNHGAYTYKHRNLLSVPERLNKSTFSLHFLLVTF